MLSRFLSCAAALAAAAGLAHAQGTNQPSTSGQQSQIPTPSGQTGRDSVKPSQPIPANPAQNAPTTQPGTVTQPDATRTQSTQTQDPTRRGTQTQQNTTPSSSNSNQSNSSSSTQSSQSSNSSSTSRDDGQFVMKAGQVDLAEINIGRLAAQRASMPEVRQFANKMVQDHQANLQMLNQIANRHGWQPAQKMDQEHTDLMMKLSGMQGQSFDREFVNKMVEGHKKALEMYRNQSKSTQDSDLRAMTTRTAQTIEQHEQWAQRLQQQMSGNQGSQPVSNQNSTPSSNNNR